ncbi:MAG: hypothetical protein NTY33_01300 [Candidatus Moranbacteria bacterium]|nr:hypothetical protein [Candidatus Moranbacteria bacterium]
MVEKQEWTGNLNQPKMPDAVKIDDPKSEVIEMEEIAQRDDTVDLEVSDFKLEVMNIFLEERERFRGLNNKGTGISNEAFVEKVTDEVFYAAKLLFDKYKDGNKPMSVEEATDLALKAVELILKESKRRVELNDMGTGEYAGVLKWNVVEKILEMACDIYNPSTNDGMATIISVTNLAIEAYSSEQVTRD